MAKHGVTRYHMSAASVIHRYHLYHQSEHQVNMMLYSGIRVQVTGIFKISASPYDSVLLRKKYKPGFTVKPHYNIPELR